MKTPKTVDIEITSACNLRCRYCSHFASAGDVSGDVPLEGWLQFFEELNRCAVLEVVLSGGEPFFRPDIKEIILALVKNRMRFSVLSNGTLITDDMADFLASTGRCNSVQVSVDGSIPTTHDAMRGRGSFIRAVEGLKTLMRHGISATVRVTIHRGNVGELEQTAAFLLEEMALPAFSTNSASYMGVCRKNVEQVMLTAQERSEAMTKLLELTEKYNGRINAQAGPLAEARTWCDMEQARREGRDTMPGRGRLTGCGGPSSKLAVRADGVIVPCNQMPQIELGRINDDDLTAIWQNHPELWRIRQRNEISLDTFEFCTGCDYIPYCTGNCPALAANFVGEVNHPSPDACLKRFLMQGGTLPESLQLP